MHRVGYFHHRQYPFSEIKRSTVPRLAISTFIGHKTKLFLSTKDAEEEDCLVVHAELEKVPVIEEEFLDYLEYVPEELRTLKNYSTVLPIEEVYPVYSFFDTGDIYHTAFEKVTFTGVVSYNKRYINSWLASNFNYGDEWERGPRLYISVPTRFSTPVALTLYRGEDKKYKRTVKGYYRILNLYPKQLDIYCFSGIERYSTGRYNIKYSWSGLPKLCPVDLVPEEKFDEEELEILFHYSTLPLPADSIFKLWRKQYKQYKQSKEQKKIVPRYFFDDDEPSDITSTTTTSTCTQDYEDNSTGSDEQVLPRKRIKIEPTDW
jgi:hypothetical protein